MKLTWHIAKKDFLRLWPLLALWWGVLVLRALLPALDANLVAEMSSTMPDFQRADLLYQFRYFLLFVLLAADVVLLPLIASAVIQADSPIRPRAHWRALPLTARQMLRAKILFLVVFCGVVPTAVNLAAKIAYGFPLTALLDGLVWYEWKLLACVVFGAMMSSLFRHPWLTLIVAAVLYSCLSVLYDLPSIWYIKVVEGFGSNSQSFEGYTLYLSRFVVWSNLWLATALIVLVCMYDYRRRLVGWLVLAAGGAIAQPVQGFWPVDFFAPPWEAPATAAAPAPIPDFSVQLISSENPNEWGDQNDDMIHFDTVITGMHANRAAESWFPLNSGLTLEWPDGKKTSLDVFPRTNLPANYADVLKTLGLGDLQEDRFDILGYDKPVACIIRPGGMESHIWQSRDTESGSAQLTGNIVFDVGQLARVADIPATTGAHFAWEPDYFAIAGVQLVQNRGLQIPIEYLPQNRRVEFAQGTPLVASISLLCREITPAGVPTPLVELGRTEGSWGQGISNYSRGPNEPKYFFVLWNPKRQQVLLERGFDFRYMAASADLYGQNEGNGLSFFTTQAQLAFQIFPPEAAATVSRQEVQAWLDDARLVELRFTPEHRYSVPVSVAQVKIPEPAAASAPTPPAP